VKITIVKLKIAAISTNIVSGIINTCLPIRLHVLPLQEHHAFYIRRCDTSSVKYSKDLL
jgi:hypothetical protein